MNSVQLHQTWPIKQILKKKKKINKTKKNTDLLIIHKPNLSSTDFKKSYKWAMETRGPKSNTYELLCLSWLPATLMLIRSKMNELARRHHSPIISLWEIFYTSRATNSVVSGPIWPKFELVRDFMHVLVTCKYKKDRIKSNRENVAASFSPIISQWGISVAMDTRVLIQSASKHYAAFPHSQ